MKNFIIYWVYFIKYYVQITYGLIVAQPGEEKLIMRARKFALMTHHKVGQKYDKNLPYYYHLDMVTKNAIMFSYLLSGKDKLIVILGALFHDLIEDCRLTYNDVKDLYGEEIADVVFACTELRGKNRKERHGPEYIKGLQESRLGTYVKICDIIANMSMGLKTGSSMLNKYRKEFPHVRERLYREEFADLFNKIQKDLL